MFLPEFQLLGSATGWSTHREEDSEQPPATSPLRLPSVPLRLLPLSLGTPYGTFLVPILQMPVETFQRISVGCRELRLSSRWQCPLLLQALNLDVLRLKISSNYFFQ